MSVINQLATSLGRRDEVPNQKLAERIAKSKDKKAVHELVELIHHKDRNIQSDSVKVVYEIGERNPALIAAYDKEFITLLDHKNNRLVWGAMSVLDCIASVNPKWIYKNLSKILETMDKGSVITNDRGVSILIKLASHKEFSDDAQILLLDKIKSCPTNQLPMYAENAIPIIADKHKKDFIKILTSRLSDIEKETKQKRVEKVIKKLQAKS
jgi:hypothetical protein